MRDQVLKGHLELLVLAAIRSGSPHGYAVIRTLREHSGGAFDLAEGTIYPTLHRLERRGLLASRWSVVGGRRRRVYRLTAAGRRELAAQERGWAEFAEAVDAVLVGGS